MMFILMLPCYIIVGLAFLWTMKCATKEENGMVLSVKIPKQHRNDGELDGMIKGFHKREKRLNIMMLLLVFVAFFIREYPVFSITYSMLWVFVYLGIMQLLLNAGYDEVYQLKKKRGWTTNEDFTISVDLEVARLKNSFRYPSWNWLILLAMTGVGSFLWIPSEKENLLGWVSIGVNALLFVVLYGIYCLIPKIKSEIYSHNSEVNLAYNRCFCLELSKAVVWSGYINSLSWIIGGLVLGKENGGKVIIIVTIVQTIFIFMAVFAAVFRIKNERKLLLNLVEENELIDDDVYWRGGIYNNPNDPKLLAEKRIGIGMVYNVGHPIGRLINWVVAGVIVGMFIYLFTLIPLDFPTLSLSVQDNVIYVDATGYDTKIDVNDIESIRIISELPRMYKNNGYAGKEFLFGKFRVIDYGQCRVYISKEMNEFFVVTTKDQIYIINSEDALEFEACKDMLQATGKLIEE